MQKLLCLSLLIFSGCGSGSIEIKNTEVCSVAGRINNGAICAETLTDKTRDLTYLQLIGMLEASPIHGAAIIMTSEDFQIVTTELKEACRILGDNCTQEMKDAIERMENFQ